MRYLHTMVRVKDLDASMRFYRDLLGLEETRRADYEAGRFTLVYLAAPQDRDRAETERSPELELTYNWGVEQYELGTAYGHIALGVPDAYAACERIKTAGGQVTREAGPVKGGSTIIAFVTDPDGYKIELIQRPALKDAASTSAASPSDPLRSA